MGWGTVGEVRNELGHPRVVRDGSVDPSLGPGRVGGPSGQSGRGYGHPRGGWGQVGGPRRRQVRIEGPLGRSWMGRGTLPEVWTVRYGSGTIEMCGTGWGILPEVWKRLGELWGGPGRDGGPSGKSGQVGGPSGRSGTCHGNLEEVQNELGYPPEVQAGLGDPPIGFGRVGGLSGRSVTGRETHG